MKKFNCIHSELFMKRAREMLDLPLMMVDPEQRADWLKLSFEEVTDILRDNKLLTDTAKLKSTLLCNTM